MTAVINTNPPNRMTDMTDENTTDENTTDENTTDETFVAKLETNVNDLVLAADALRTISTRDLSAALDTTNALPDYDRAYLRARGVAAATYALRLAELGQRALLSTDEEGLGVALPSVTPDEARALLEFLGADDVDADADVDAARERICSKYDMREVHDLSELSGTGPGPIMARHIPPLRDRCGPFEDPPVTAYNDLAREIGEPIVILRGKDTAGRTIYECGLVASKFDWREVAEEMREMPLVTSVTPIFPDPDRKDDGVGEVH